MISLHDFNATAGGPQPMFGAPSGEWECAGLPPLPPYCLLRLRIYPHMPTHHLPPPSTANMPSITPSTSPRDLGVDEIYKERSHGITTVARLLHATVSRIEGYTHPHGPWSLS